MDFDWLFSPTIDPRAWLTGNTAPLVAMFVLSAAVAIVGCAQAGGGHKHSAKVAVATIVAGAASFLVIYATWDYLRTMNRAENLWKTELGRIADLSLFTGVVTAAALTLIFLGYYVTTWNNSQAHHEERRASYAGKFMTGAGMLLFIHIALMVLRIWNEQTLIDTKLSCRDGVCVAQGEMAMMPLWPLAILGLCALGWMLCALPGFVMWRRDKRVGSSAEGNKPTASSKLI